MKGIIYSILLLSTIILTLSGFVLASPPQLPMIISGNASVNNHLAHGAEITAKLNGSEEIISNAKTDKKGEFILLLQKLKEGQEVMFFVDGIYANKSISYKSGDFEQLSLKVEKSYLIYYFGVALVIIIGAGIIWKHKNSEKHHGRKHS